MSLLEEHEKSHFNKLIITNSYSHKSIMKLISNRPLFNYSMMLEEFSLKSLDIIVYSWIAVIWPDENFEESRKQIMQIKEQIILFLFKLFIKSTNLKFLRIDSDKILNHVPNLQQTIGQFLNISKLELGYAAQHMSINSINFLEKISTTCNKIDSLIVKVPAFENNPEIKNSIISIINAQKQLKEFSFRGVDSWIEEIIKAVFLSQANSLISIKLECVNISESSLNSLAKCKILENFVILNYSGLVKLRNNFEFKTLKKLYIRRPLMNIKVPNLMELTLDMLTQKVMLYIIENCPNITHLTLNNYRPVPHDQIFKTSIQKLHITYLTINFLYSKSIISESSILSKEFLPPSLRYLVIHYVL
ncbi:18781_t:CDS:2 [Dentiscutata erythropus]|uniref:18781_t:CDS:1 n=1 Tax=Dentiscutata erythropus TaxID=1348616 RepID=A0A9N8WCP1_9GLOM|nr:18781_t:CDS:2 [Dentiscutata erythropus]